MDLEPASAAERRLAPWQELQDGVELGGDVGGSGMETGIGLGIGMGWETVGETSRRRIKKSGRRWWWVEGRALEDERAIYLLDCWLFMSLRCRLFVSSSGNEYMGGVRE